MPGNEPAEDAASRPLPARAGKLAAAKEPWPPSLPAQMQAIARLLAESPEPLGSAAIAARYSGKGKSRLPDILAALEALGRARRLEDGRWMG